MQAPKVYFHPLEDSLLADPELWFQVPGIIQGNIHHVIQQQQRTMLYS